VAWARELHRFPAPPAAKNGAWKAWGERCTALDLSPQDLAAEAREAA
jgi:hypothetical protein